MAATGIEKRHARACRSRQGGRCNCTPTFQASVWDRWRGVRVRRTFPLEAAAKSWRHDAVTALRKGPLEVVAEGAASVSDALDALIMGMESGAVLDRSGKAYKPATVRSYEQAARCYLKPALGKLKVNEVRRRDVQALVEALRADGLKPSTIHNKLDPLRVLFRRAIRDELATIDPTDNLELPAVRGRRENVATRERAGDLLAALPDDERPPWTVAFYGGLRVGELRALRWDDVDFEAGVIHVRRGWDDVAGEIELKSDAGRRKVPLAGLVRRELAAHKLRTGRSGADLVFGRSETEAFVRTTLRRRALKAWGWKPVTVKTLAGRTRTTWQRDREDALEPLTPHEARHTCASYLIASGLNPKQVQTYIGHSDIRTTYNVYGHLLPGDEEQAAAALDAFLASEVRDSRATVSP